MEKVKKTLLGWLIVLFKVLVAWNPIQIADLDVMLEEYKTFDAALPGVKKFVVLKAMFGPKKLNKKVLAAIVKVYGRDNVYADAASPKELALALEFLDRDHIIFTNTNRSLRMWVAIWWAQLFGKQLKFLVVDSICGMEELIKFANLTKQQVNWSVRFAFADAVSNFGAMFGIEGNDEEKIEKFLHIHRMAETCPYLNFVGGTCHVGTQNPNPSPFLNALKFWKKFFMACQAMEIDVKILDIGGGFPVAYSPEQAADHPGIVDFCQPILESLDWFLDNGIEVICEPGRVLFSSFVTTFVSVTTVQKRGDKKDWVFVISGILYGLFSLMRIEKKAVEYSLTSLEIWLLSEWQHSIFRPIVTNSKEEICYLPQEIILAGGSCDGGDEGKVKVFSDEPIKPGDVLVSKAKGSYAFAGQCPYFNPQVEAWVFFIPVKRILRWLHGHV